MEEMVSRKEIAIKLVKDFKEWFGEDLLDVHDMDYIIDRLINLGIIKSNVFTKE